MPDPNIAIVIVEDQTLVRDGIEIIVNLQPDMQVVGTANNGQEGYELVGRLRPHIVLMDIEMPIMNGIISTQRIKADYPDTIILLLTTFSDEHYVVEGLAGGASGILLKDFTANKLTGALREAMRGELLLPASIAAKLAMRLRSVTSPTFAGADFALTPREIEIATLLIAYKNNREIAEALFITEGTVKNYISVIYEKVGMNDRAKVIARLKGMLEHG
ncbi:two component transcriptional regulator, LuxR family [Paenibacillus curdlanolyticus YK9]|uniref:Two component transcriptional regulator, LuxR family n=1 Tax=Paenibacillus curdlanolyticus YK9 TaxID=717606 RepID=E0IB90_9BACL|nr:response regulator transcription factor [Paenibacillus curdlanolyticus]EFM10381.1 two component transcriptional regulator, LuxR family [Paenibacillus curdlanolyticus YK9]